MAVTARHRKVSTWPNSMNPAEIQTLRDWNDDHVFGGGTNGQQLVADDTQTTGTRWQNALEVDVRKHGFRGNEPGHDDRQAIQDAIDEVGAAGGGIVRFPSPAGTAWIQSMGYAPHAIHVSYNHLTIDLNGWTLRDTFGVSSGAALFGNSPAAGPVTRTNVADLTVRAMSTVAKNAMSITLTTPAQASEFTPGDAVYLRTGANPIKAELNEVFTANASTGVIQLRWPVAQAYAVDGVTPFGIANCEADVQRDLVIKNGTLACHITGLSLSQWLHVRHEHLTYEPLATDDGGPPFSAQGNMRHVTFHDTTCELPYAAGGGGLVQSATGCTDWTISHSRWRSNGITGQVLNISEYSARISVHHNYFSGKGQIAGAHFEDLDFHDNYIVLACAGLAAVNFCAAGTENPGQQVHHNTIISLGVDAPALVMGASESAGFANTIRSSGLNVDAVQLVGSGQGLRFCGNIVSSAWGGILLATTDHRVDLSHNVCIQTGGSPAGNGISVADNGVQIQGPRIKDNTVIGFLDGVVITALTKEPGIDYSTNQVSGCTTDYVPAVATRHVGADSPEGVVTATVGSSYQRTDGGANTSLYVKESGSGNTGWVAK